MQAIRARVRTVAVVWLLCQAASLAAFIPEDCCIAHAEARAAETGHDDACHDAEPVEPQPGDACPMHSSNTEDCCVMKGACGGPGQQLTTLFAYIATLERPMTVETLLETQPIVRPAAPLLIHRTNTPDAPPPKA